METCKYLLCLFHPHHHLYYELPVHQALPLFSARPFLGRYHYYPLHEYPRAFFFLSSFLINCSLLLFWCVLSAFTLHPNRKLPGAKGPRGLRFLFHFQCYYKFRSTISECMGGRHGRSPGSLRQLWVTFNTLPTVMSTLTFPCPNVADQSQVTSCLFLNLSVNISRDMMGNTSNSFHHLLLWKKF